MRVIALCLGGLACVVLLAVSLERLRSVDRRVRALEAEIRVAQGDNAFLWLGLLVANDGKTDEQRWDEAIRLRDRIYRSVPLARTPKGFNFVEFGKAWGRSVSDRGDGHICGGLTILYVSALEAAGIPARYVGIFSRIEGSFDSHASVEFNIGGRWYASDPTFNTMFTQNGEYLSYSQVFLATRQGQDIETVSNGFALFPARLPEDYYISRKQLMQYMVIHPARTLDADGEVVVQAQVNLPEGWDGRIRNTAGEWVTAQATGGIYGYLYDGPAR